MGKVSFLAFLTPSPLPSSRGCEERPWFHCLPDTAVCPGPGRPLARQGHRRLPRHRPYGQGRHAWAPFRPLSPPLCVRTDAFSFLCFRIKKQRPGDFPFPSNLAQILTLNVEPTSVPLFFHRSSKAPIADAARDTPHQRHGQHRGILPDTHRPGAAGPPVPHPANCLTPSIPTTGKPQSAVSG